METKNFTENFNFNDQMRGRHIAVAIYFNHDVKHSRKIPVVFLNHGGIGSSTEYSYLANFFADHGYAVIAIQHNFIGDAPHTLKKFNTGVLKKARLPIWELWEGNMLFVIHALKTIKPNYDLDKFTIAGHSTGGDLAMFFTTKHPHLISNIISLDGRRCPFPRNAKARLLLIQANDTTTDKGVIPDVSEKHKLTEMVITKVDNAVHNDYSDYLLDNESSGSKKIKKDVLKIVGKFLGCAKFTK